MYKKILLAIDLHPECDKPIIERALNLAKLHNAELYVLHVVEHIPAYSLGQAYPTVMDLEEQIMKDADAELKKITQQYRFPAEKIMLENGSPKNIIIEKADKLHVDLIIVGSHGRHGISLLLGSTANAVLHHAPCDVLAVRIKH